MFIARCRFCLKYYLNCEGPNYEVFPILLLWNERKSPGEFTHLDYIIKSLY